MKKAKTDHKETSEQQNKKIEDKLNETKIFTGLCINCEHRFICKLPRPETGVWYCEEYE